MAKYTQEINGATERVNELLKSSGYKITIGHRNNYTAIDITNLCTNSTDYLTAGLTDKQALEYIYTMCKTIGLIKNPSYNKI